MYVDAFLILLLPLVRAEIVPGDYIVVLRPGESIEPGTTISSPNNNFKFAVENSRIVVYATCDNSSVFSTSDLAGTVSRLELDNDGNLMLYGTTVNRSGNVWQSATATNDGQYVNHRLFLFDQGYLELCAESSSTGGMECYWQSMRLLSSGCRNNTNSNASKKVLKAGQSLHINDTVFSPSGEFKLIVQTDSNVVIYRICDGAAVFSTYSTPGELKSFSLLNDGNLVVRGSVQAFWPDLWYAEPWANGSDYKLFEADKFAGSELRFNNDGRLYRCKEKECYWQSEFFSGSQCARDILSSSKNRIQ